MKILYFGGQKSGKSLLAEQKVQTLSSTIYYIATYDNSYNDTAMQDKITKHRQRRDDKYITIEAPIDILSCIKPQNTYIIECMSMWVFNMLIHNRQDEIEYTISQLARIDANIVFVINDVSSGIIPLDSQTRQYVDINGTISQYIASICDDVYMVACGIATKIK